MNKKLMLICSIAGFVGGILFILYGIIGDTFPMVLRYVASAGLVCNCVLSVVNLRNIKKSPKQ